MNTVRVYKRLGPDHILTAAARILVTARDLSMFNKPSNRDYLSVKRYFEQTPPICNVENYIFCKEDIITLKPGRESTTLDHFMEKMGQKLPRKIIRVLLSKLTSTLN